VSDIGDRIGPRAGQSAEDFEREEAIAAAGMYEQVGRLVHHLGMYEMTLLALVQNLTVEKVLREMARVMQVEKRTKLVKDLLEDRGYTDFHAEFETLAKRAGKLFDERAICTHNLVTAVRLHNHNPEILTAAILRTREIYKTTGGRLAADFLFTIDQVRASVQEAEQLDLDTQNFMHRLNVARTQPP
jgi:hypothetical protein